MAAAEESRALATNPGYRAIAVKVDVKDLESVRGMVESVVGGEGGLGRVDYGVCAAGVSIILLSLFSKSPILLSRLAFEF